MDGWMDGRTDGRTEGGLMDGHVYRERLLCEVDQYGRTLTCIQRENLR